MIRSISASIGGCYLALLLLLTPGCDTTESVSPLERVERKTSVRTIPVPFESKFAQATTDGGPSGAIEDMQSDWSDNLDAVAPSPYGCQMSWPSNDPSNGLYRYYKYYYFFPQDLLNQSGGERHRLKFVVTSPAAPKKNTMSEARCWIPASDRAQMITVAVLKSWAERRNNSDAPLSFRSGLY